MNRVINSGLVFVVVFFVVGCGGADVSVSPQVDTPPIAQEVSDTVMEKTGDEMADKVDADAAPASISNVDDVINTSGVAPVALPDVSGGTASGFAWTALGPDQKTYHKVVAKGMPALDGTDFYEGWLVRDASAGEFFSTGKMTPGPRNGDFRLEYSVDGDFTDHTKVVITLEPDDGDPAPAAHIIEN